MIDLNSTQKYMLKKISDVDNIFKGAYNIRENGKALEKKVTENINIIPKEDKSGIDIYVKENTKGETIHIPVIITKGGVKDLVYNDFYIGKNADVTIVAGCGIHSDSCETSEHDGIHRFYLEQNSKVKYVEKHYGTGKGTGEKILNPTTEVYLKKDSYLEMETVQIEGVDSTVRKTIGKLEENSNLVVVEKIMTHDNQFAKTEFEVELNGENSSTKLTSRSVAKDNSTQEFISNIVGNTDCFGHVECDAIIMDNGKVKAIPMIQANDINANLIHEAAIGKIAGEQVVKLMTLGLTKKQAEKEILNGFLK